MRRIIALPLVALLATACPPGDTDDTGDIDTGDTDDTGSTSPLA